MTSNINGSHEEFIRYLFSNEPKEPHKISLELPLDDNNKNMYLHIFEQLLMIFTDGAKYLHGVNGKVNVNALTKEDIDKIDKYFISFGYRIIINIYETINDYQFKFPNYFKDKKYIDVNTKLEDFFYEIFSINNKVFRISFTQYTDL